MENANTNYNQNASPMSVGEWVITLLITFIPIVNIVMLFVWGFSSSTNACKANWAKAALIWMAIGIILWLIFGIMFGAALMGLGDMG